MPEATRPTKSGKPVKKTRESQGALKAYIVLYNVVLSIGWAAVLWPVVRRFLTFSEILRNSCNHTSEECMQWLPVLHPSNHLSPEAMEKIPAWITNLSICICDVDTLYDEVVTPLKIFQSAAFLEIFHSAFGLVNSPIATVIPQVFSRLGLLYVVLVYPQLCRSPPFIAMIFCWSLTEVVRYLFYAASTLKIEIYVIKWLRYTMFIVLYPLGVYGELALLYTALPFFDDTHANVDKYLPPPIKISYIVKALSLLYVPGFPFLFFSVVKQRTKQIGWLWIAPQKAKKKEKSS